MHASGCMPNLNHATDGGDEVGGDSDEDADYEDDGDGDGGDRDGNSVQRTG